MKSRVFLTPMSPDGKPGEVVELQYNDEGPRQFVAPVSPYARHALPDAATTELEKERDALIASLPKLKGGARAKAEHRIRVLEREITAARSVEESERRTQERVVERKRQQVGADSPFSRNESSGVTGQQEFMEPVAYFAAPVSDEVKDRREKVTRQTLAELVSSAVAGVKALPTPEVPAVKKKAKMSWAEYLKDLDERLAVRALEALRGNKLPLAETGKGAAMPASHGANVCCSGSYLCERCRAA